MLPKTVRGAVEVAAGLVEEVGKRVVVTAAGLLERTGIDVTEVERRLGGQFPRPPSRCRRSPRRRSPPAGPGWTSRSGWRAVRWSGPSRRSGTR